MKGTKVTGRVDYAQKEVERYYEDVEDWKHQHDELKEVCWPVEDVVAKANFIFDNLVSIEMMVRELEVLHRVPHHAELEKKLLESLGLWLRASNGFLERAEILEDDYGEVEGAATLRANIKAVKSALTPDAEYFRGQALERLEATALREHHAGRTEPLLDNEPQS